MLLTLTRLFSSSQDGSPAIPRRAASASPVSLKTASSPDGVTPVPARRARPARGSNPAAPAGSHRPRLRRGWKLKLADFRLRHASQQPLEGTRRGPAVGCRPESIPPVLRRFYQRQDAGPDRLRQVRPRGHQQPQLGIVCQRFAAGFAVGFSAVFVTAAARRQLAACGKC